MDKQGKITSAESKLVRTFLKDDVEKRVLYFYPDDGLGIPEGKVVRITIDLVEPSVEMALESEKP